MCCGDTVPTSTTSSIGASSSCRAMTSARAPSTMPPHVFGCGCGSPVLPDVKAIAATCSRAIAGGGHVDESDPFATSVADADGAVPGDMAGVVAQVQRVRIAHRQLRQRLRRARRRQQAGAAGQQRGTESDRKQISIAAAIQHILRGRQLSCKRGRVRNKPSGVDRHAARTAIRASGARWPTSDSAVIRRAARPASVPLAADKQESWPRYAAACAAATA